MPKLSKTMKRRLCAVLGAVALLFCLVLEIGTLFPSLGLPSWKSIFTATGLRPESVTPQGELQVHFIDVGNADCILIRQGEANALIDAGERSDGETILAYLREQGIEKLDFIVATHPHADHIGSMATVVNAYPPTTFIMSFMPEELTPTTTAYLTMLEALDANNVPVEQAEPGAVYSIGTSQLTVLAPLSDSDEANNISVVTRLTFGERSFLFAGDAEIPVEEDVMNAGYAVQADVLKVAHHGSNTSSSEAWLARVNPSVAVVTCAAENSYGHPHAEVLERLDDRGVDICRADIYGHIVFTSDGTSLSVNTQKGSLSDDVQS